MSTPEADIHFELYRHLQNTIEKQNRYHNIQFENTRAEVNVDSGFADIVVYRESGKPFLVIEAKRKTQTGYDRNIDPYSPKVIDQAFGYAGRLGADYFATYNGKSLVLFDTFEKGTHLLDRKTSAYSIKDIQDFASSLLQEVTGLETGEIKWEPRHRAFVKRLDEFHDLLMENMEKNLRKKLNTDPEFKETYEAWVQAQGWEADNQKNIIQKFTAQAAYLLMNKLLFYKILEDEPAYEKVPQLEVTSTKNLTQDLQKLFTRIVDQVDFEAVYEQDPIYDKIPLKEDAAERIQEFLEELEEYDLTQFDHDVIGTIYEEIIPPKERHDLGQYYTPPEVVELITKLTIQNPEDRVLDPGCGSGSFLVAAYNRLKKLKEKAGNVPNHLQLLDQVYGIDINRFPAHLSAINLALRDLSSRTDEVNLEVQDFFHIYPKQDRLAAEKVGTKGVQMVTDPSKLDVPTKVDVVMANPPYIRQEKINDKQLCRKHLERIGYKDISERSDIYVYFFTHATEFLKENGRIGFITSDKWLTTEYGEDLQEFFLNNYKIQAIIKFNKKVFEGPLVPTCVTLLEECSSTSERKENRVKLVRVKHRVNMDELINKVKSNYERGTIYEDENFRIICKTQKELAKEKKWDKYLYAPRLYWEFLSHPSIIKIDNIATLKRKITSGCNDFFYLENEDVKEWGIDKKFLRPLAKSVRQTKTISFEEKDTDRLVLDLNKYVTSKVKEVKEEQLKGISLPSLPSNAKENEIEPLERYVLKELFEDGYKGLYNYIVHFMWEKDWGRYNPPQLRPTCQGHRKQNYCWFNLGKLTVPDLMVPEACWKRIFVPLNVDDLVADRNLYDMYLSEGYDKKVVAGLLNSNLFRLFREIDGRVTGGGASRVVIYEVENMPIIDPSQLSQKEAEKIKNCLEELLELEVDSKEIDEARMKLDKAVLEVLDMEDKLEELNEILKAISKARREGKETKMLIEGLKREKQRKSNIHGGTRVNKKSQKSLKDFNLKES